MSAGQKVRAGRNKVRRKQTFRLNHGAGKAHTIRTCCPLRHAATGYSRCLGGGDTALTLLSENGVASLPKLMHMLGR
eukprot:6204162-Pleurochrysis_carterae.AAC.7